MLEVRNLTKRFASTVAVDDISFSVGPGEIVGFLGPNGAGKTTTIRILAGFIPATSGTAVVAGHDVFRESLKVRESIGYLPENVPLYTDMRVSEYLTFRAGLKKVPRREIPSRVDDVAGKVGLTEVRRRVIGHLSKGYRQRVGLAETLVNNPPILILDEPTAGLDPNQRREVKNLITELGRSHTIFLSSHILAEVESVCTRILIIHEGRIIADDTPTRLKEQESDQARVVVELKADESEACETLRAIPGVLSVSAGNGVPGGDGFVQLVVRADRGRDVREEVFTKVVEKGWPLRELKREMETLEDVFARVTLGSVAEEAVR